MNETRGLSPGLQKSPPPPPIAHLPLLLPPCPNWHEQNLQNWLSIKKKERRFESTKHSFDPTAITSACRCPAHYRPGASVIGCGEVAAVLEASCGRDPRRSEPAGFDFH